MNQNSGKFNIPRLLNYYLDNIIKGKEKDVSSEDEIDVKKKKAKKKGIKFFILILGCFTTNC